MARDPGSQAGCTPHFPDTNGWYGGDAAYSVVLPEPGMSLWLFGDTFVDQPGQPGDRDYPFIHNSIGISRCSSEGVWDLETFWNGEDPARPKAFFEPDPASAWFREAEARTREAPYYWLFGGFTLDDVLFVGLLRVAASAPRGPFRLPFQLLGMDLARVENPLDPPNEWLIEIAPLSESRVAFPGAAFVVGNEFLYAFAFYTGDNGEGFRFLTRLRLDELQRSRWDPTKKLQTFDREGRWIEGFEPKRARRLMSDAATEMSVHYDPAIERWVAIHFSPAATESTSRSPSSASYVRIRVADALTGPWSGPEPLFPIPETDPDSTTPRDDNIFCYAAKAHPQFASSGHLLVTYVCNLFARSDQEVPAILERLQSATDLYRPTAVSVPIPPMLTPISTDD